MSKKSELAAMYYLSKIKGNLSIITRVYSDGVKYILIKDNKEWKRMHTVSLAFKKIKGKL